MKLRRMWVPRPSMSVQVPGDSFDLKAMVKKKKLKPGRTKSEIQGGTREVGKI